MKNSYLVGLYVYQDAAEYADSENIAKFLLDQNVDDIFKIIQQNAKELPKVTTMNIPVFSKVSEVNNVLAILLETGETFEDVETLGRVLGDADKAAAQRKYGETHYRLAALLGFTTKTTPLRVTELGTQYHALNADEKDEVLAKLVLRIPIIQDMLIKAKDEYVTVNDMLGQYLSEKSAVRRRSSTKNLVNELASLNSKVVRGRIDKLIW